MDRGYIDQIWLFLKKKLKSYNIAFIFDLEYRYAILSRGMHHNEFLIMSQCSSNPCELRETQKPRVHIFGFDPVSNPVAPILGNWWHRFSVSWPNG
jgi:hypothetical protein